MPVSRTISRMPLPCRCNTRISNAPSAPTIRFPFTFLKAKRTNLSGGSDFSRRPGQNYIGGNNPVERARGGLVADRRPHGFAADHALRIHGLHQPRYRAAGDVEAFAPKLTPDLANAVDLEIPLEHAPDLDRQGGITPGSRRSLRRIGPPRDLRVVRGRGDRQHLADRLDPISSTVIVDERDHAFDRRSSSARAK